MKFTKLSDPQLAFLQIIIKKKILKIQDRSLLLIKIILGNNVEECTVESSAYECFELDVMDRRSFMKMRRIRKNFGKSLSE